MGLCLETLVEGGDDHSTAINPLDQASDRLHEAHPDEKDANDQSFPAWNRNDPHAFSKPPSTQSSPMIPVFGDPVLFRWVVSEGSGESSETSR